MEQNIQLSENKEEKVAQKEKKDGAIKSFFYKFFHIGERGSTIKQEVLSGLLMGFVAVCFFLVNVNMIVTKFPGEANYCGIYVACALICFLGSFLIGIIANLPLIHTSGLVTSSMLIHYVSIHGGLTYANMLFLSFIGAIFYVVLIATPLKKFVLKAIPSSIKKCLPILVGLSIIIIALQQSGLISFSDSDHLAFVSVVTIKNVTSSAAIAFLPGFIASLIAIIIYIIIKAKNSKHAGFTSFIVGTILFFLIAIMSKASTYVFALNRLWFVGSEDAYDFMRGLGESSLLLLFTKGLDFSAFKAAGGNVFLTFVETILLFSIMALAEDQALIRYKDVQDEKGEKKALIISSAVGVLAPIVGIPMSNVSRVSALGEEDEAKTGLSSIVASLIVLVSMFTWVLFIIFATWTDFAVEWYYGHYGQCMNYYATAKFALAFAVMFICGVFMIVKAFKQFNEEDKNCIVPIVVTIVSGLISSNIVIGLSFGVIAYFLIKLFTTKLKDFKEIPIPEYVGLAIAIVYCVLIQF